MGDALRLWHQTYAGPIILSNYCCCCFTLNQTTAVPTVPAYRRITTAVGEATGVTTPNRVLAQDLDEH